MYHSLCIHSPADTHLGCFHLLALVNNLLRMYLLFSLIKTSRYCFCVSSEITRSFFFMSAEDSLVGWTAIYLPSRLLVDLQGLDLRSFQTVLQDIAWYRGHPTLDIMQGFQKSFCYGQCQAYTKVEWIYRQRDGPPRRHHSASILINIWSPLSPPTQPACLPKEHGTEWRSMGNDNPRQDQPLESRSLRCTGDHLSPVIPLKPEWWGGWEQHIHKSMQGALGER